jgi:hypothetical protein
MRKGKELMPGCIMSWIGLALAALNAIIAIALFQHGFEGSWGGFFVFLINLPISVLALLIDYYVQPKYPWLLVLTGVVWWYVIGWWIERCIRRRSRRRLPEQG